MKKELCKILTVIISVVLMQSCGFLVSAEDTTEDYEFDISSAVKSNGSWGQSVIIPQSVFNCKRFTKDTVVTVEYEVDGEAVNQLAPVELILQNFSTADPQIWAKIAPFEYDENSSSFKYEDMISQFGSDDLSSVDNICIGDTGVVIIVTKMTASACLIAEKSNANAETEAVTEKISETEAISDTVAETDKQSEESDEEKSPNRSPVFLFGIITVIVGIGAVGFFVIKNKRGKFY